MPKISRAGGPSIEGFIPPAVEGGEWMPEESLGEGAATPATPGPVTGEPVEVPAEMAEGRQTGLGPAGLGPLNSPRPQGATDDASDGPEADRTEEGSGDRATSQNEEDQVGEGVTNPEGDGGPVGETVSLPVDADTLPDPAVDRPAKSAPKAEWTSYVERLDPHGNQTTEGLTKDELIDLADELEAQQAR